MVLILTTGQAGRGPGITQTRVCVCGGGGEGGGGKRSMSGETYPQMTTSIRPPGKIIV